MLFVAFLCQVTAASSAVRLKSRSTNYCLNVTRSYRTLSLDVRMVVFAIWLHFGLLIARRLKRVLEVLISSRRVFCLGRGNTSVSVVSSAGSKDDEYVFYIILAVNKSKLYEIANYYPHFPRTQFEEAQDV